MDLTQKQLYQLQLMGSNGMHRVSELLNRLKEAFEDFAKVIKETLDRIDKYQEYKIREVHKEERLNKVKMVLKILSPKNIIKRIKQFVKRKV